MNGEQQVGLNVCEWGDRGQADAPVFFFFSFI